MIDIYTAEGVFTPGAESALLRDIHAALAAATDVTDVPAISSIIGAILHVVPRGRYTMGGVAVPGVRIDVALPAIALASFRRRRRFIRDATAAVVAAAGDPSIADRTVVQVFHLVDGGYGIGGVAHTNDELDEGPDLGE